MVLTQNVFLLSLFEFCSFLKKTKFSCSSVNTSVTNPTRSCCRIDKLLLELTSKFQQFPQSSFSSEVGWFLTTSTAKAVWAKLSLQSNPARTCCWHNYFFKVIFDWIVNPFKLVLCDGKILSVTDLPCSASGSQGSLITFMHLMTCHGFSIFCLVFLNSILTCWENNITSHY